MRSISSRSAKASAATLSAMARTAGWHVLGPRRAEARARAVGQDGVDRGDVVHHVAVADRAAAAGIVAGHAAQGALRRGRDVDRIPEAVRLQPGIELVEHDARLDRDLGAVLVEAHDLAQVLGDIDDQRLAHRLAALRGAGAARQDRGLGVARHVERPARGRSRRAARRRPPARSGRSRRRSNSGPREAASNRTSPLMVRRRVCSSVLSRASLRPRPRPSAISRSRRGCAWRTPGGVSPPSCAVCSFQIACSLGDCNAFTISGIHAIDDRLRRALDGPHPYQVETIQFGTPISAEVGISGNSAMRCGVATASPSRLAGRICSPRCPCRRTSCRHCRRAGPAWRDPRRDRARGRSRSWSRA